MATKLTGILNLTRINKETIFTNRNGDKCIFIDVVPNRDGADQYGNTHAVTLYNKEARQTIYLGNLKPQEFGKAQPTTDQAKPEEPKADEDLPF